MNLNDLPVMNSGPVSSYNSISSSQGPNISLISKTMEAGNALTILIALGLGAFIITIILLMAVYAKR